MKIYFPQLRAVTLACYGQGTTIHEYPWNPDWNNDNFVEGLDLISLYFFSAFGIVNLGIRLSLAL